MQGNLFNIEMLCGKLFCSAPRHHACLTMQGRRGNGGVKDAVAAGEEEERAARVAALPSSPEESRLCSMVCFCDGEEWEYVEWEDGIEISDRFERFVFGPVPSTEEAASAIQQMFVPIVVPEAIDVVLSTNTLLRSLSIESQSDWVEHAVHLYSSKTYQSQEGEKVLDAFRMLQINPFIQRIVISLSSDRNVWDAVMKNDVVQEFKKFFYEAERKKEDPYEGILMKWIQDTKLKIMQTLDRISKHVSQIFHSNGAKDDSGALDDVLRSSFMLCVVVFIIVVMNRARRS